MSNFSSKAFFSSSSLIEPTNVPDLPTLPPRLVSDQLINVFFQEWAPLYPVLHRPTFLKLYADYVSDPDGITEPYQIAQLNLVFGVAALAQEVGQLACAI